MWANLLQKLYKTIRLVILLNYNTFYLSSQKNGKKNKKNVFDKKILYRIHVNACELRMEFHTTSHSQHSSSGKTLGIDRCESIIRLWSIITSSNETLPPITWVLNEIFFTIFVNNWLISYYYVIKKYLI